LVPPDADREDVGSHDTIAVAGEDVVLHLPLECEREVAKSTLVIPQKTHAAIGDEFAVFLDDADRDEAIQVAERIRENVRNVPRAAGILDCGITVSVGVCVRQPGQNLEDILLKADRNLYAAKGRGRDCVVDDGPALAVA
jgi:diguanylate cyclase (GGDEF)-like protein